MSLINQMLNDLEKRRANELEVKNGALQSVNRYVASNTGGQSALVLGVIIGLVVLLSILVGYLLWDKFSNHNANDTMPSSVAVVPPAAKQIPKKQIASGNRQQKIQVQHEIKSSSIQTPPSRSKTTSTKRNKTSSSAKKVVSNKNKVKSALSGMEEEASDNIYKQNRSLTRTQQAAQFYQKAYANLKAGQVKLAEEQLRQSLIMDASFSRARELLAGSYIRSGRYVEAGKLLQQGLKVEPKNYHFAKLYARVLMQQNRQKQALDMLIRYRPALQVDQDYFALVAALYQQTGQHHEAVNMYKDLLKLQPGRGLWWVGMGISLEKTGKATEARNAYQRAKESGSLNSNMRRYTDNRLAAIKESGYPEQE